MNHHLLWRDSALTPKIFILDARAVFPLGLWLELSFSSSCSARA